MGASREMTLDEYIARLAQLAPEHQAVKDFARFKARCERLEKALGTLFALVNGECPRLLDEDSGGDALLYLEINAALADEKETTT